MRAVRNENRVNQTLAEKTLSKEIFHPQFVFSEISDIFSFFRLQAECCPHGRENESHCSNFQPESEDENSVSQSRLRGFYRGMACPIHPVPRLHLTHIFFSFFAPGILLK